MGRAEKEARKDAERQASKRRRGKQVTTSKRPRRGQGFDQPGTSASEPPATSSGAMPPLRHPRAVPGPLGPCWRCGAFGHLAASCTATKSYPLSQPVVSSAEVSTVDKVELSLYVGGVNGVAAEPGTSNNCTVKLKASDQSVWYEGTDEQSASSANSNFLTHDELDTSDNLTKFWEAEGSTPVQISDVQGCLKQKLPFWKEVLQAPPPVLDCIEHGYRLQLKCIPQPFSPQNHKSTGMHHVFVQEAVLSLLEKRCVQSVDHKPYVDSPLSVVCNTAGKLRLVLNLRYLNQFLHVVKFKYEDLRIAALMFEPNEYIFKFDLKSGYHHVDIHPDHFQFLGFQWEERGVPSYYVFTVLPFGLSTACYVFTKLMRPLVRFWRGKGLKVILYLDDGIVSVKGKEQAMSASNQVKTNLENAGSIINAEKSIWVPSQAIEWLDFHLDIN